MKDLKAPKWACENGDKIHDFAVEIRAIMKKYGIENCLVSPGVNADNEAVMFEIEHDCFFRLYQAADGSVGRDLIMRPTDVW